MPKHEVKKRRDQSQERVEIFDGIVRVYDTGDILRVEIASLREAGEK
ncbi:MULTISPECIES: hypothetical protein [unclassified Mameliella]|nr:hypothetical protein [Mameliella sp. LZ-28]MCR9274398.1 hypothetical protein [Paracoccaceae bacterium]